MGSNPWSVPVEGAVGGVVVAEHERDLFGFVLLVVQVESFGQEYVGTPAIEESYGHFVDEKTFGGTVRLVLLVEIVEKFLEFGAILVGHDGDSVTESMTRGVPADAGLANLGAGP